MNANGRSALNTVVSLPSNRASPRTAVSEPSVTMNGGSRRNAISTPLPSPITSPVSSAARMPRSPQRLRHQQPDDRRRREN